MASVLVACAFEGAWSVYSLIEHSCAPSRNR